MRRLALSLTLVVLAASSALAMDPRLADFWVRIEHHESLHAHDAVGVFIKGVKDGYRPTP